ncbi:hypothetical protein TrST_g9729 [Triparma strigata]|uniref:Uncharacterized protein n=1 Tax=Triparma strigata TaxID=1606541 RepID=A0A9W6ZV64_9STRA|nr:hypothetical protein TrST_g9729 [Triparma strigata]
MWAPLCLSLFLLPSTFAIEAPTSPPFGHPRGLGEQVQTVSDTTLNVLDFGASTDADGLTNQKAVNSAIAALSQGDSLVIPKGTFKMVGGVVATGLRNVTITLDGVLEFEYNPDDWPLDPDQKSEKFMDCIHISESIDVVITSSTVGLVNGGGKPWWDKMIAGTLPPKNSDSRPKLIHLSRTADVLIEKITMVNSPSWNLVVDAVRAEIRNIEVKTDREYQRALKERKYYSTSSDAKDKLKEWLVDKVSGLIPAWLLEPEDLNTDGIDPSGIDFWIHDVKIHNDDDSIAVKPSIGGSVGVDGTEYDCSQNMLLENMELVGFGASIGSVPPNVNRKCVDGITMRNVSMPGTGKGIYIKSNGNDCIGKTSQLSNLLFEDFSIIDPFWYAIWIGPQQQHEPGSDLGLDCALIYPLHDSQCPTQGCSDFENITFRNVEIVNPKLSPGAILGNSTNPMRNIHFENVVVKQDSQVLGRWPWHEDKYPFTGTYESINCGTCTCNGCSPLPEGFVEV